MYVVGRAFGNDPFVGLFIIFERVSFNKCIDVGNTRRIGGAPSYEIIVCSGRSNESDFIINGEVDLISVACVVNYAVSKTGTEYIEDLVLGLFDNGFEIEIANRTNGNDGNNGIGSILPTDEAIAGLYFGSRKSEGRSFDGVFLGEGSVVGNDLFRFAVVDLVGNNVILSIYDDIARSTLLDTGDGLIVRAGNSGVVPTLEGVAKLRNGVEVEFVFYRVVVLEGVFIKAFDIGYIGNLINDCFEVRIYSNIFESGAALDFGYCFACAVGLGIPAEELIAGFCGSAELDVGLINRKGCGVVGVIGVAFAAIVDVINLSFKLTNNFEVIKVSLGVDIADRLLNAVFLYEPTLEFVTLSIGIRENDGVGFNRIGGDVGVRSTCGNGILDGVYGGIYAIDSCCVCSGSYVLNAVTVNQPVRGIERGPSTLGCVVSTADGNNGSGLAFAGHEKTVSNICTRSDLDGTAEVIEQGCSGSNDCAAANRVFNGESAGECNAFLEEEAAGHARKDLMTVEVDGYVCTNLKYFYIGLGSDVCFENYSCAIFYESCLEFVKRADFSCAGGEDKSGHSNDDQCYKHSTDFKCFLHEKTSPFSHFSLANGCHKSNQFGETIKAYIIYTLFLRICQVSFPIFR